MPRLFAVAAFLLFTSCCGCIILADSPPDLTGTLQIIGRFGMAHACPIAPDIALTNSHVVDPRPFDPGVPVFPLRWSQVGNPATDTVLLPLNENRRDDLVIAGIRPSVDHFYVIAKEAPKPGDRLWWVAYDWRNKERAFSERLMSGRLVRIVAGHLIVNEETFPGSSGSCVLNDSGELVGIVSFGAGLNNGEEVAGFVGVYGNWINMLVDSLKKDEINP